MAQSTKIIFFGTSDFAVPVLETLVKEGYEIVAVVTNPDEPVGRKKNLTPPSVKVAAQKFGLRILQPEKLKGNQEFFSELKNLLQTTNYKLQTSIGVVAAYGKIIPSEIITLPKHGILNIHPSLLPKYRGPTPIQSTILNDEKETGVTIIKIDEEIDHGPIIASQKSPKESLCDPTRQAKVKSQNFEELQNELTKLGAELLIKVLPDYLAGKIKPRPQDHSLATFTKKFTREDGKIDWSKTAEEIDHQIHALNPEPGTWTIWNGKILKILEARIKTSEGNQKQVAGQVSREDEEITVGTGRGKIILKIVQPEGKKVMSAEDFARGNRDFIGAILK